MVGKGALGKNELKVRAVLGNICRIRFEPQLRVASFFVFDHGKERTLNLREIEELEANGQPLVSSDSMGPLTVKLCVKLINMVSAWPLTCTESTKSEVIYETKAAQARRALTDSKDDTAVVHFGPDSPIPGIREDPDETTKPGTLNARSRSLLAHK